MTVRPLEMHDIAAIREIDRLAFDADEQYALEFYTGIPASDIFVAFVAEDDGAVAGWALLDKSVEPIRLRSLSVHPDRQRRGCGKALLQYTVTRFGTIDLLVRVNNEAAIALYENCGFSLSTPDPELPGRLRMRRPASSR